MVAEILPNYATEWASMKAVAAKLGIGAAETVRTWVRKAEFDAGRRPGTVVGAQDSVRRVLRMVGLDALITCHPTVDQAVAR